VVRRDELKYYREFHLLDPVTHHPGAGGDQPDGSCFRLRNDFLRQDGTLAARLTSTGGWLDLSQRRLVVSPEALADLLEALSRTEDFEELPPLQRR
jgi:acyl-CoA thioester hydrolase